MVLNACSDGSQCYAESSLTAKLFPVALKAMESNNAAKLVSRDNLMWPIQLCCHPDVELGMPRYLLHALTICLNANSNGSIRDRPV